MNELTQDCVGGLMDDAMIGRMDPPTENGQSGFLLAGARLVARRAAAGLHVVATPIGNLADITLRALETLAGCDLILAEDTRVSRGLLTHYGIGTPLSAHHQHNEAETAERHVHAMQQGRAIALISDAGTPLLSDPGGALVRAVIAAGVPVFPLPGASALLAALVGAGIAADRFSFEGFLPVKSGDRRRRLRELAVIGVALVLYEAPQRLVETLRDIADVLGARQVAVGRELTKLFEEFRRGDATAIAGHYLAHPPKGECVIVISAGEEGRENRMDDAAIDARLIEALQSLSARDAASVVAAEAGLPRRVVYARAIALGQGR